MCENRAIEWHRSSRCAGGTCVEVARSDDKILIRDGKDPEGVALSFTEAEWEAFVNAVKANEFARLSS